MPNATNAKCRMPRMPNAKCSMPRMPNAQCQECPMPNWCVADLGTEYPMPARTQWAAALAATPGGGYCPALQKNRISWRIAQYRSYGSYKTYLAEESHSPMDTQRIRRPNGENCARMLGIIRRGGAAGRENRSAPAASVVNSPPAGLCDASSRADAMFRRRLPGGRAFGRQKTAATAPAGQAVQGPLRRISSTASEHIATVLAFCPCPFASDSYNHHVD